MLSRETKRLLALLEKRQKTRSGIFALLAHESEGVSVVAKSKSVCVTLFCP